MTTARERILRRVNGHAAGEWASPATVSRPLTAPPAARPTCPKRCDVSTPPEHARGDRYVCVCCGTEFTWRPPP